WHPPQRRAASPAPQASLSGSATWLSSLALASYPASGIGAILAEEIELFLHRPIGEAEEHGFLLALVANPAPARRDEDVAWTPFEHRVAHAGAAFAFDDGEHRGVGRAVASGGKAFRQQLDERADAGHGMTACHRVGVAELQPVTGIPVCRTLDAAECLARCGIGIAEDRRGMAPCLSIHRQ